jgi:hypothetical protein
MMTAQKMIEMLQLLPPDAVLFTYSDGSLTPVFDIQKEKPIHKMQSVSGFDWWIEDANEDDEIFETVTGIIIQ